MLGSPEVPSIESMVLTLRYREFSPKTWCLHLCDRVDPPLLFFDIIGGDGHQPNSRGLYTHYKDSLLKVG